MSFISKFQTLTYVAEITQPKLRGTLASTSTVAVISGILIQFLLGTFLNWRNVALVSCIFPIISTILLFFVPESPHWLISKNRFLDARKSLAWLRGWTSLDEIEAEFKELSQQFCRNNDKGIDNPAFEDNDTKLEPKQTKESTRFESLKLYGKKSFLWPYSLVSFTFLLGHFSGMTTLQTYAVKIFAAFQAPIDKYYATISLGIAEVCGCILSVFIVHNVGKRFMNFFSLVGCASCFLTVATYAHFTNIKYLEITHNFNQTNITETSFYDEDQDWTPMILLILAAFFTHAGIRILPWMLIGEVYSSETRATASGLSGGISYIFGFISNKIFLTMVNCLTLPGTFWLYSGICIIGGIILYFILPETEGKSLFEITEHFAGNGKLDNKVYKKTSQGVVGEVNRGFDISIDTKL